MISGDLDNISHCYDRDGYYFPIDVMSEQKAASCRRELEYIETDPGEKFQDKAIWFTNANFVLPFVDEISRLPAILEPIIRILGPDLLVWNASFFTKEPKTPDFVSWHQDLKYWGLSDAEEVTARGTAPGTGRPWSSATGRTAAGCPPSPDASRSGPFQVAASGPLVERGRTP